MKNNEVTRLNKDKELEQEILKLAKEEGSFVNALLGVNNDDKDSEKAH